MADHSKLTPVRVTDRNGWLRTVYRRFVGKPGSDGAAKVPAPRVAAHTGDRRLPSVRRRPRGELREFADKLGAPMAKHAYEMFLRPGGREAGSLALDLIDSGAIHEKAMLRILYDAANVRSPGHLHDTLRVAQRLGGTPDEASLLGDLRRGVVGFRRDPFSSAQITTERELDEAAAVVGFTVRPGGRGQGGSRLQAGEELALAAGVKDPGK